MGFVVILDPGRELLENGGGIGPGMDAGVVALERLHEGLADAVIRHVVPGAPIPC